MKTQSSMRSKQFTSSINQSALDVPGSQAAAMTPPRYGVDLADASSTDPMQRKADNNTGLPDTLKTNIETQSGLTMDDVQVHYNSSKPARLQAHAYTQGTHIHVAPGQEQHLPHEAWHVVQQKQGRVRPTMRINGAAINADPGLEREADEKSGSSTPAPNNKADAPHSVSRGTSASTGVAQLKYKVLGMLKDSGLQKDLNDAVYGTAVPYLDATQRQQYLVTINNGLLHDGTGQLMDTNHISNKTYIFVMDSNGNIYSAPKNTVQHHSAFLSGRPVAAAGHMRVTQGVVDYIDNQSGHYRPPKDYMKQFKKELEKRGVDLSNTDMQFGNSKKEIKKRMKKRGLNPSVRLYTPDAPQKKYY
jgi:hypothetical protein